MTKACLQILMEGSPQEFNPDNLQERIEDIEGVTQVSNLQAWIKFGEVIPDIIDVFSCVGDLTYHFYNLLIQPHYVLIYLYPFPTLSLSLSPHFIFSFSLFPCFFIPFPFYLFNDSLICLFIKRPDIFMPRQ